MRKQRTVEETERRRARECEVVLQMIHLYCHDHHHTHDVLCPVCAELAAYACKRIERCPFMQTKSFCSQCPVHCYAPKQREQIREVMRYAGPRMLLDHPVMCLHHGFDALAAAIKSKGH